MSRKRIPTVLILAPELVADEDVQVSAPVDATAWLHRVWSRRAGRGGNRHPYLRKAGVYIIASENADVLYIGCTTHPFDRYLRTKLGVRDIGADVLRPGPGNYWERSVRQLDYSDPEIQEALTRLRENRIRLWLLPIEYIGAIAIEKKRSIRALEATLLRLHTLSEGRKPVLNYEGTATVPVMGQGQFRRGITKVDSFLRRHVSPTASAGPSKRVFSDTEPASWGRRNTSRNVT